MKAKTESGKTITIDDKFEIKRGGEGKILTIPELPAHVAKIYLNSNYKHMSKAQKDALNVLDDQIFVKPLELIFDKKKDTEILGFTMEYLNPDFVPLSAYFSKNFCLSNQVDEKFKLEISEKMITAVEFAHQKDIIIGDLNPFNILVNQKAEVKFIDVDSYETPVHTHWAVLFDEIRDYLYQGKVCKESDYFALAINIFNLFTHLHPFKGIHKEYKAMAERMIRKIPVFAQDPNLIVPKCYEAIQDRQVQEQFEDIFLHGKRFLLQIGKTIQVVVQPKTTLPITVIQTSLKYREIYKVEAGEYIQNTFFTNKTGFVATNQRILVFDCSNHGYTTLKHNFTEFSGDTEFFTGDNHIFIRKDDHLMIYREGVGFQAISNLKFSPDARYRQIGNILVVLDQDFMRFVYLDQVIKDQIHIEQNSVFTAGFDVFNGLIQNAGGVQYVFYHSGKNISTVKSAVNLQMVKIRGNVGIAVYEEKLSGETKLNYEYFDIQNLQMKLSGQKITNLKNFAFKATSATAGVIFEPTDDKMIIRRSGDFQILQEVECSLLSTESTLFSPAAGIIALEKDYCYLLNSN